MKYLCSTDTPEALYFSGVNRHVDSEATPSENTDGMSFDFARKRHVSAHRTAPPLCVLKWGGLGSVLTTRPFLQALRDHFGKARQIIYITSAANAGLVERMNLADRVLILEPNGSPLLRTLRLGRALRSEKPAMFFDLQIHTHRGLGRTLARLSGAHRRFGFFRARETIRRNGQGIFANPFAPLDQLYLEMARLAGATHPPSEPRRALWISHADEDKAGALLHGWLSARDRLLIVNPNASATALVRRWPLASYAEAIGVLLAQVPRLRVALIGAASERDYVGKLHQMVAPSGNAVRNFAGLTTLGSLMALITRADCVLSNDSGPLHLALALGARVVGLFGPVHPDHNAHLGPPARKIILYHPVLCSPCVHHVAVPPCGGNNLCMQLIAPEDVVAACRRHLSDISATPGRTFRQWHSLRDQPGSAQVASVAQPGAALANRA